MKELMFKLAFIMTNYLKLKINLKTNSLVVKILISNIRDQFDL